MVGVIAHEMVTTTKFLGYCIDSSYLNLLTTNLKQKFDGRANRFGEELEYQIG